MKKMTKISTGVALAIVAGLSTAAHASSGYNFPSFTGAGSPGDGFVSVDSLASLTQTGAGTYVFSITSGTSNTGVLNFGAGSSYAVSNEGVTVTAELQRSGNVWNVTGGSYSITGNVAACSSGCPGGSTWSAGSGTLFSASLGSGHVVANTGGDYIGFNSSNFSGWAVNQHLANSSGAESLYLYASNSSGLGTPGGNLGISTSNSAWNALVAALSSGGSVSNSAYSNIGAYSTVPLPLGAVLLLSGLAGLGGMARRKAAVAV